MLFMKIKRYFHIIINEICLTLPCRSYVCCCSMPWPSILRKQFLPTNNQSYKKNHYYQTTLRLHYWRLWKWTLWIKILLIVYMISICYSFRIYERKSMVFSDLFIYLFYQRIIYSIWTTSQVLLTLVFESFKVVSESRRGIILILLLVVLLTIRRMMKRRRT